MKRLCRLLRQIPLDRQRAKNQNSGAAAEEENYEARFAAKLASDRIRSRAFMKL
jgi:hypothetical protein